MRGGGREGAVAIGVIGVVDGVVLEEGAFFEEAATFEVFDGFIDEFLFVYDTEANSSNHADGEEEPGQE